MQFNSDEGRFDQILDAPWATYLAAQPGRDADGQIVAVLTFRFSPAVSFESRNICLTQAQTIRLRDDLHSLLTTPESWLYTGRE